MNFEYDSSEPEIRAEIQLLKAHIEHKAYLNYEISQMKIRTSYKSSADSRDFKGLTSIGKQLFRRLSIIRYISQTLKETSLKEIPKETLQDLLSQTQEMEPKLELPKDLFSINFELDNLVNDLKNNYDFLSQDYQTKTEKYSENQARVEYIIQKEQELSLLEREVIDYTLELEQFASENKDLSTKKQKVANKKRESVDKVKIFQHLSENAMKLRSKLLLKEELIKNIKSAEKELDELNEKILVRQEKLRETEQENEENRKNVSRFEVDLHALNKKVKKLEIRLQGLEKEKCLLTNSESKMNFSMPESSGANETMSISGIISGFTKINKEKNSLFEENLKLKERLSKFLKGNE